MPPDTTIVRLARATGNVDEGTVRPGRAGRMPGAAPLGAALYGALRFHSLPQWPNGAQRARTTSAAVVSAGHAVGVTRGDNEGGNSRSAPHSAQIERFSGRGHQNDNPMLVS